MKYPAIIYFGEFKELEPGLHFVVKWDKDNCPVVIGKDNQKVTLVGSYVRYEHIDRLKKMLDENLK